MSGKQLQMKKERIQKEDERLEAKKIQKSNDIDETEKTLQKIQIDVDRCVSQTLEDIEEYRAELLQILLNYDKQPEELHVSHLTQENGYFMCQKREKKGQTIKYFYNIHENVLYKLVDGEQQAFKQQMYAEFNCDYSLKYKIGDKQRLKQQSIQNKIQNIIEHIECQGDGIQEESGDDME